MLAAYAGLRSAEIAGLDRRNVTEALVTVAPGQGRQVPDGRNPPGRVARIRLVPPGPIAMLGSGRVMTPSRCRRACATSSTRSACRI
jgi:hypothetical protein